MGASLRQRAPAIVPECRLWLSSPDDVGVFGDGKWRLLAAIQSEGSLRAAAASVGMSYRKAWGELRKAEERLGIILVAPRRGGVGGGTTELTTAGRAWIQAYGRFRARIETEVADAYREHLVVLLEA